MSSAEAAEKGNAGEESSAAAGIEKPKQKRRRRTKEEVWGSGIVDVALQLHDVLPKMASLQESIAKLVAADELLVANHKNDQLLHCLQHVQIHPVCHCCLIKLPSNSCQAVGVETWRYHHGTVISGFC